MKASPANLPFRVTAACTVKDVTELVKVRSETYLRHAAPGADRLRVPELQDYGNDAILLVARSKLDDAVIGSVRIQTRLVRPLMVESAMELPVEIVNDAPLELMRGSVRGGAVGNLVSSILAKASYQVSRACAFGHIVVTCREPVNLMYRAYQFDELMAGAMIDLPYSPGAKHKVLNLPVKDAEFRWRAQNLPLYVFMVETSHVDIAIDYDYVFSRLQRCVAGPPVGGQRLDPVCNSVNS